MSTIGQPERITQNRVIALFRDELGYDYLGDWTNRDGNSNIEASRLSAWLTKRGAMPAQIGVALHKLRIEADNHSRTLYANNQAVYNLLRYGVPVKIEAGKVTETVHLIDWQDPERNDFAIAEEVTLKGNHERRPDLVLYVNGIALGVIELKNSRVSIGDGIRQSLSNQQPEFNAWFFSTVQFIFAGNDSEGLQYGGIGTPLLAKDRATSLEVFGGYIHTYKFSEGVEDGIVLDLVYEARDIDQRIGSENNVRSKIIKTPSRAGRSCEINTSFVPSCARLVKIRR